MLDGAQHAFGGWLEGVLAISQETTRFMQARLEEDVAAWSELAACRNPGDFRDCQQRFATKAAEEYAAEFGKLSQMVMGFATRQFRSVDQQRAA
jgi:hypothetical protein